VEEVIITEKISASLPEYGNGANFLDIGSTLRPESRQKEEKGFEVF